MFSRLLSKFYSHPPNVDKLSVGVNTEDAKPIDEEEFENVCKIKDSHIHRFRRLYRQKASECRDHLERISVFEKQVREKENASTEFSESILTKKNINDFLEVHRLLMANKPGKVQNKVRYLKAIKNLFIGIQYGIVPVVSFQYSRLSSTQRKLIRAVNRQSVTEIKDLFNDYQKDFVAIFRVVGKTLEFLKAVC